jgi:hypothetical protein
VLPDGLFLNQTHSFGTLWKAFEGKNFDIFYDHWYTWWPVALFWYVLLSCVRYIAPI